MVFNSTNKNRSEQYNMFEFNKFRELFELQHPPGQDAKKFPSFYQEIASHFNFEEFKRSNKLIFILVAHRVSSLTAFAEASSALGSIAAIIPKASLCEPNVVASINKIYESYIRNDINKQVLLRDAHKTQRFLTEIFAKYPDHKLVIFDHGGYFAPRLDVLMQFKDQIAAIGEHTWNGVIRYQLALKQTPNSSHNFPIFSVARSRLKAYEDEHVGNSTVDAMRGRVFSDSGLNQEINRAQIGIIGFGHIGEAVVRRLLRDNPQFSKSIRICELDNAAQARARLTFSNVSEDKTKLLKESDIIITATSSIALTRTDFNNLKEGACIVCVTSCDDQFSGDALADYEQLKTSSDSYITQYKHNITGKKIYLAANGCSVNFMIGSTPHPILHAIFSAICVAALRCLQAKPINNEMLLEELQPADFKTITKIYTDHFGPLSQKVESFGLQQFNRYFVGRKTEMAQLKEIVAKDRLGVITQKLAGKGGRGKTTLATHYASQALENNDYDYIAVLSVKNENHLYEVFKNWAIYLGIFDQPQLSPQKLMTLIYQRLAYYSRVLIIFDDVPDYNTLQKAWIGKESVSFLPPLHDGQLVHCIITTRNSHFKSGQMINLPVLELEESVAYIKHYLPNATDEEAKALAKSVGNLPLALAIAVACIVNDGLTIPYYLSEFEKVEKQREILQRKNSPEDPYQETVYTTWDISFAALEKKNKRSIQLLNMLAYFASQPIPFSLLKSVAWDLNDIDHALGYLEKYSLINIKENQSVSIHDLVQMVVRLKQEDIKIHEKNLEGSLKIIQRYQAAHPKLSALFVAHGLQVIKFHDQKLPAIQRADKIQLLLVLGSSQYYRFRFARDAIATYELAEQIYNKGPGIPGFYIPIQLALTNSWSGAAHPLKYIEILEKMFLSDELKVEDIEQMLKAHRITIDYNQVKQEALKIIPDQMKPIAAFMSGQQILTLLLQPSVKSGFINFLPQILEGIGAVQLAIVYLLYKGDLLKAREMAERYLNRKNLTAFERIEASCLLIETKMLQGKIDSDNDIVLLKQALGLLATTEVIDKFWQDQVYVLLSVLYALQDNFINSRKMVFDFWECIEKNILEDAKDSIKQRTVTIIKLFEFFVSKYNSEETKSMFAQAFRIAGHLSSLFDELHEDAQRCFEKSIEYNESCLLTQFEFGVYSYHAKKYEQALECFTLVQLMLETNNEKNALTYKFFPQEGTVLPHCLRILCENKSEQAALPLYFLTCSFLTLSHYRENRKQEAKGFLQVLADNIGSNHFANEIHKELSKKINTQMSKYRYLSGNDTSAAASAVVPGSVSSNTPTPI